MKTTLEFVEAYTLYVDNGGSKLSRRLLVTRLLEYFGDNLVALSYPGIATVLAFRSGAAKALRIIPDEDDSDVTPEATCTVIDVAHCKVKEKDL